MTAYTTIPDSDIDPESPGTATLFTRLRNNPIAIAEGSSGAPSISASALSNQLLDLYYLGSGLDGAKVVASSENLVSGEYHYTNLTINSGQTLGVSSTYGGLVIRCTGTATIVGAISAASKGASGGAGGISSVGKPGYNGYLGGGGGSGGADGSLNSGAGGDVIIRNTLISGGAAKTSNGGGIAGTSLSATTSAVRSITSFSNDLIPLYSGAGGGGGSGTGGNAGAGGRGGGVIILIADTIDFQSGAVITANGGAGVASGNDGGGGGGGGGVVVLAAKTITNEGSITTSGGAGGSGIASYHGGAGGAGYSTVITLT